MNKTDLGRLRSATAVPEGSRRPGAPIVVLAEPGSRFSCAGVSSAALGPSRYNCGPSLDDNRVCEAMGSSCGDSEGRAGETVCPSQLPENGCPELLHELSNLMTGVLLNAQMLEWKLPPYSHLKRPVREVARNAQRSGELMKALLRRCGESGLSACASTSAAAAAAGRDNAGADLAMPAATCGPHGLYPANLDLTAGCDTRTSNAFPKRDDRDGR